MSALLPHLLLNVRAKQVICNCDAHCGELVQQIEAQLPNGRPVVILKDWSGWHVAVGNRNSIGHWQPTLPVSEEEVERILRDAMESEV